MPSVHQESASFSDRAGSERSRGRVSLIPLISIYAGCLMLVLNGCGTATENRSGRADQERPTAGLRPGLRHEMLTLETGDGVKIAAQFGLAVDANDVLKADYSSRPTVVYCYPPHSSLLRSQKQAEAFQRLGMNVIIPEYPGIGLSDGRLSEAGCYAAAGAAYEFILAQSDLDHGKIYAAGWSVGGGAAVDLASQEQLAGLLIISSSINFSAVVREMADHITKPSLWPKWLPRKRASVALLDNMAKIQSISCPLLLLYGTDDELVPVGASDRFSSVWNYRSRFTSEVHSIAAADRQR